MKKKDINPFDNFTINSSPEQFFGCIQSALTWLEPYLDEENIMHEALVRYCASYARILYIDPADQTNENDEEVDWPRLVMRQRQIVTVFDQVRSAIISAEALAQANNHSKTQSERASKPRKLTEEQHARIASVYWEAKTGGTGYGIGKRLAADFGVSPTTIQTIARKHRPN